MRALVVYESMFGNTKTIAEAIQRGIAAVIQAQAVEVGQAPPALDDVALLVVGGPTHAFSMSRDSTRQDAGRQASGPVVSQGPGIREWLESFHADPTRTAVATFDTRVSRPRVPGSAARAAAKVLRRQGFGLVASAETFWVNGTKGPLLDGEEDRATSWGESLARQLVPEQAPARV